MVLSETPVRITLLSCDSVFIVSTRALGFKGIGKAQFRRIGRDSFEGGVTHLLGRLICQGRW